MPETHKFACRFCWHDIDTHNTIVGCPYCRCAGTRGEGFPNSDKELNREPVPAHRYRETLKPKEGGDPEPDSMTLLREQVREHLQRLEKPDGTLYAIAILTGMTMDEVRAVAGQHPGGENDGQ